MEKHPDFNWRGETQRNIRNNIRGTQIKLQQNLK